MMLIYPFLHLYFYISIYICFFKKLTKLLSYYLRTDNANERRSKTILNAFTDLARFIYRLPQHVCVSFEYMGDLLTACGGDTQLATRCISNIQAIYKPMCTLDNNFLIYMPITYNEQQPQLDIYWLNFKHKHEENTCFIFDLYEYISFLLAKQRQSNFDYDTEHSFYELDGKNTPTYYMKLVNSNKDRVYSLPKQHTNECYSVVSQHERGCLAYDNRLVLVEYVAPSSSIPTTCGTTTAVKREIVLKNVDVSNAWNFIFCRTYLLIYAHGSIFKMSLVNGIVEKLIDLDTNVFSFVKFQKGNSILVYNYQKNSHDRLLIPFLVPSNVFFPINPTQLACTRLYPYICDYLFDDKDEDARASSFLVLRENNLIYMPHARLISCTKDYFILFNNSLFLVINRLT